MSAAHPLVLRRLGEPGAAARAARGRRRLRRLRGGRRHRGMLDGAAPGRARLPRRAARGRAHWLGRLGPQRRAGDLRRRRRPGQAHRTGGPRRRAAIWDISVEALDAAARAHRAPRHRLRLALGPDARRHQAAAGDRAARRGSEELRRATTATPRCAGSERDELRALVATRALHRRHARHAQRPPAPAQLHARARRRRRDGGRAHLRGQPVHALRSRATRRVVHTAAGRVRAKHVALCGNAWLGELVAAAARAHHAGRHLHRGHRAARARRASRALLRENIAVTDINWVLDYFRRSADHRLLFGGRVSYSGLDPLNTEPRRARAC